MNSLEVSAKTVEEAINEGLKALGVKKNNVKIEILSEPSQGILKILGSKNARVKLTVLRTPEEYVKDFLNNILKIMGLNGEIKDERDEEGNIILEVSGKNLGVLIGRRGNTLNALQYLTNVAYQRQFSLSKVRVFIDVENYRLKRKKTLEQLARNLALKALRTKKEITLEPMTPQERRIIHMALKNNKHVVTYSQGEEPNRQVVISPR